MTTSHERPKNVLIGANALDRATIYARNSPGASSETLPKAPKTEQNRRLMPRATVEMSFTLDIRAFVRNRWWYPGWHPGRILRGSSHWAMRGKPVGSISWIAYPDSLQLVYTTTDARDERTVRDDLVPIVRDVDRLGRQRVWFICPGCARYVLTLHSPTDRGSIWFRCRTCHGLSYHSRQEHTSVFGRLMNRVIRLERQVQRPSSDGFHELFEKAQTVTAALDKKLAQHSQHHIRKRVLRPPGRPSKLAARAEAAWLRSLEPPVPVPVQRPPGRPKTKRAYVRRQPLELQPTSSDCEAFCVRRRDRRPLKRARRATLSNGRPALRGRCAVCETRLCRLLPASWPAGAT